ncbi:c-type cytochrome [Marinobacter sp. 1_MG-2023]|uniref:c-type cytochrome n=1 Tax=Marinobacter sp. 1_MG-2023 TaxID=3062627 RepID=UPI0026E12BF9|nr:c-type cytochrome [Marinobacter sp. 1_MG-2023]MDO6824425.1 c-type cytochrome [Marinobacter sp. 1_MG-2023]
MDGLFTKSSLSLAVAAGVLSFTLQAANTEHRVPTNIPQPQEGQFVHVPPTMDDLEKSNLHPELKGVIRRGHDLFVNTQQLRGKNVFNSMNCSSCHLGEGRQPFSAPVWPAAVVLPNYRTKNDHVNSLEERIVGCFSFSMNGKPPEYGSDNMLALAAYHQWLAKGVPMYQSGKSMYGRGFPKLPEPEKGMSFERGKQIYEANCSICHAADGSGLVQNGEVVFPPLWGDASYNWGAGISRNFTLSSFIKHNMPLGQPNSLTGQESWDVAYYINSHERPQDPRYTGNVKETREKYLDTFHKYTNYGLEVNGRLLGDHDNLGGEKDFLKPDALRPRTFSAE